MNNQFYLEAAGNRALSHSDGAVRREAGGSGVEHVTSQVGQIFAGKTATAGFRLFQTNRLLHLRNKNETPV